MKTGLVIKSTGSWYVVKTNDGRLHNCRLRGLLRMKDLKTTNPVAVGDKVDFEESEQSKQIVNIHNRKNYIIRKSSKLSKQSQIIASNIDQAFLIVTLNFPLTTTNFIDRFLVAAEAYQISTHLIFNKVDLYGSSDLKKLQELEHTYQSVGYKCLKTSAKNKLGIEELGATLKGRINLISGHSGVGKSSLINLIEPELKLKTKPISEAHGQGKHTTTFAEMFELHFGGYVIDTPGIRGFGIIDMDQTEIFHFFPEIFAASQKCKFHNCLHINEPGCAVKEALGNGKISLSRYQSYLKMTTEDQENKYRI